MNYKITLSLVTFFALLWGAQAELRVAQVFGDGMVLQRDQKVPVWGWADAGESVTVSFGGSTATAKANIEGAFSVKLKKMKASAEPRELTVSSGDESVTIANVLVGEVWLCSGQSNMEMSVSRAKDAELEIKAANYPLIRRFASKKSTSTSPQEDAQGQWQVCSPQTVGSFSATAYYFAREIYKELDVPVGLLQAAWGGTSIEAWSPVDSLSAFEYVMNYKAQQDKRAAQYTEEASEKAFADAVAKWEIQKVKAAANGRKSPKKPVKAGHPHKSQNYPGNLYNAMLHPLVPYGIRGALWYQGERNAKTNAGASLYRDQLDNLVTQWRKDWGTEFPFYAVQLVNYRKPTAAPIEDTAWAFIRESFLKFHREVPHAGIAIGIDVGEATDIHPKNKQAIGYRLAQQALAKTYEKGNVAGGPIFKASERKGNTLVLSFDDIGSGLVAKGGPLTWFAIAGEDQQWVRAEAEVIQNAVVVSSAEVKEPVAVRYAWADNPEGCNLYNEEGFPASPFRTDDWAATAP